MNLLAGERLTLEENKYLCIVSGKLEVYAATKKNFPFQQMFLMETGEGDKVFPAQDKLEIINFSVYAVTDAEIELCELANLTVDDIPSLRLWFSKIAEISWIRALINHGDDMLQKWHENTLFDGQIDNSIVMEIFLSNEDIFSMLINIRFGSEDVHFKKQLRLREQQHYRLLDESVAMLLSENPVVAAGAVSENKALEEVTFIIRRIAHALDMPTENISVSLEIAKKLDQLGLIKRLIQKAGMQIRFVHLEENWHKKDSGVILGYYGEKKELAAILPLSPKKYIIVTKTEPKGIPLTDETEKKLDRDAFACYAGLPSRKLTPKDLLDFIIRHTWKNDFQAVVLASFISGVVALAVPVATETVFSDIIPIFDYEGLVTVTQIVIVAAFTTMLVGVVRSIAILRISTNADMSIESALLSRVFALPTAFFRRFQSGELVGRLTGVTAIKGIMRGGILEAVFNLSFSFWSLALMCYYSMKLTMIALFLWLLYVLAMIFISQNYLSWSRNQITAHNKTAGLLQQIFSGLSKFKLHGAESQAFHLWSQAFGQEWKWNFALRWQTNHRSILNAVEPLIILIIIYYVLMSDFETVAAQGRDPYTEVITYAKFVAFQTAFAGLNATINAIIPLTFSLFSARPYIENILPILEEVPEAADERMDAGVLLGNIQVEHLSFSYAPESPPVLEDINLRIEAGESVAIVGCSGCGKSTFVRLLMGFEKPSRGAIYFDGQDLADLNLASVRMQMGVVLQNGQLMTGDIFSNIVGTSALSMDDAWQAAEAAGIADDIRNMPMGMKTIISEGSSNISGGQRQRILIARALAGKPAIIIFDEATSALDNRTQAIVTESLNRMKTTRITVAHRLSTIRDVDRILFFDKGVVAESGTFDELVKKGGLFAEFVKRQVV